MYSFGTKIAQPIPGPILCRSYNSDIHILQRILQGDQMQHIYLTHTHTATAREKLYPFVTNACCCESDHSHSTTWTRTQIITLSPPQLWPRTFLWRCSPTPQICFKCFSPPFNFPKWLSLQVECFAMTTLVKAEFEIGQHMSKDGANSLSLWRWQLCGFSSE